MQRIRMGTDTLVILSPRERQVLALVATGLTNKEISNRLRIAPGTVKTYVSTCCANLALTNRVELTIWTSAHPAALLGDAVSAAFVPPDFAIEAA